MEIDNLLYVNPNKLLSTLKNKPYVYSYHREGHFNTGIFFVKNSESLQPILESFDNFKGSFRSEMIALHSHYQTNKADCLFPLIIPTPNENRLFWKDYSEFDNHLFDGAILGIYYFGLDTYHTQGKLVTKSPDIYSIKDKFLNFWTSIFSFIT